MRIPRMNVATARDLLDLGFKEIYELEGRSPESLFVELQKRKELVPANRLQYLRLAVYFAEVTEPDPKKLHPDVFR